MVLDVDSLLDFAVQRLTIFVCTSERDEQSIPGLQDIVSDARGPVFWMYNLLQNILRSRHGLESLRRLYQRLDGG
jgi:hypothetical protein